LTQPAYFGRGSIQRIQDILKYLAADQVFLVCGSRSYVVSGAASALVPALAGREVTKFTDFSINPQWSDIQKGLEAYRESGAGLILAVGGGSAIDVAKAIAVCSIQPSAPEAILRGEAAIEYPSRQVIAVPTTAGSGSEATQFAVVYDGTKKYSIAHESMLPTYCVVDPDLTESMWPRLAAVTGVDALAQAIESYWAVESTHESQGFATKAIELAIEYLPQAVHNPSPESREAMSLAAHMAGKAINVTRTTAPHALSYPVSLGYNVPHGHAVGLTLGDVLVFNAGVSDESCNDPRGAAHVRASVLEICRLMGCEHPDEARLMLNNMLVDFGLPIFLEAFGIDSAEKRAALASEVNVDRLSNNPRRLTPTDVVNLYEAIQ